MTASELARLQVIEERIYEIARDDMGLQTTEILFKLVSPRRMIEAMAYQYPVNFSHWSHGRDYEKLLTTYEHSGEGIPYEVVWSFEVPEAYLVATNPFALNALVMAHVAGHVDFHLSNNLIQRARTLDMGREARGAAERFQKYEERYGVAEVERIIDAALSIQWQQDPDPFADEVDEEEVRDYLLDLERAKISWKQKDDFARMRDPAVIALENKEASERLRKLSLKTPPQPDYELLGYILKHSPKPLKPWMRDILGAIRKQAHHLNPHRRTKLLNEGWATYCHTHIMRQLFEEGLLTAEEHATYSRFNAGVLAENPIHMNWYRVGVALYEDVKRRWDKGQFGREWEECKDPIKKMDWDTGVGGGKDQILLMRRCYTDHMAIEEMFTDEFIHGQKLYVYEQQIDPDSGDITYVIVENDPAVLRQALASSHMLYNMPRIYVADGNYHNAQELYLVHEFSGFELDPRFENGALENIQSLWGRTVHLQTVEIERDEEGNTVKMKKLMHRYDGSSHSISYE